MINVITLMVGDEFFKTQRFSSFDSDNNYHDNDNNCYFLKKFKEETNSIFLTSDDVNLHKFTKNLCHLSSSHQKVRVSNLRNIAGALCLCLLVADYWDDDQELIIAYGDEIIDLDAQHTIDFFRGKYADIGLVTFRSDQPYRSYVNRDDEKNIIEIIENKSFSDEALAGFFYFKKANIFYKLATAALLKSRSINDIYYFSACLNEAILEGVKLEVKEISHPKC